MIKKYGKIPRILPIISCLIVILVGCTSITIPIQKAIDVENTDKLVVTEQTQNFENYISLSKAKDVMSRKEDFIGKEFSRSYEEIGSPSLTTRYIDYDDMIEDTHTTPEEYIYPINSESGKSALYIYLDNHKVLDVKIDDFSGVPDNKWRVTPYTVNSYSLNLGIGTNIDVIEIQDTKMELNIDAVKEMYLNKPLLEFKVKYELIHGFNEVYKNGTELNLSVFPIIDENNASGSGGLYVLSDNGIIKAIKIDRPDVEMERLDEHFSSESY